VPHIFIQVSQLLRAGYLTETIHGLFVKDPEFLVFFGIGLESVWLLAKLCQSYNKKWLVTSEAEFYCKLR
jgi:hypothetical protein